HRRPRGLCVAPRRFDLDDVRTEVREETPGQCAPEIRQVDDTEVRERRLRHLGGLQVAFARNPLAVLRGGRALVAGAAGDRGSSRYPAGRPPRPGSRCVWAWPALWRLAPRR